MRDLNSKNCPLRLVARHADNTPEQQQTIETLDERVQEYLSDSCSDPSMLKKQIFFLLSPLLLKLLSRYCHLSRGCGVNCVVAELLSTAYIEFDKLIKNFDSHRHVNFLGYIVQGLTWRIFNRYVKERHYSEHHILVGVQDSETASAQENENRWLSAIEVENLLSVLRPSRRHLILLHDVFGYSCADLAALEEIKTETVQKRIERARKKMLRVYNAQ